MKIFYFSAKYIFAYRFEWMQYITPHMLKSVDTESYFKNYKRYIMNPWHIIPTCSISLLYPSDHLVPCGNKPITLRFCCIHFAIEEKKKYCICQLIIPDVSTSCTLSFVYEHILLQVNTVILAENSAWWIWILLLCIHYFLRTFAFVQKRMLN